MSYNKNQLAKSLAFVFLITVIAKITGFAREIIYGSQLGTTSTSDNFVMAQTIPMTLYSIVTQAFRTTYIPNLFRIKKEAGKEAGAIFTGYYLLAVATISILFFVVLQIFAEPITRIFAVGFTEENITQTVHFARVISVSILFGGVCDILNGYLQSESKYNTGVSLTIFSNIVFCVFILQYTTMGVDALLLGIVLAKATELIILIGAVIREKLSIKLGDIKYLPETVKALGNSAPVVAGSAIADVGKIIDKRFASLLASGTVSGLNYAQRIEIMVVQLFSTTIGAVIFPELSKLSDEDSSFVTMLNQGIRYILIVMTPIMIGAICVSQEIVSVFFERGAFTREAVVLTAQCLSLYAPAMVFTVGYEFLSKACFAIHDTKTPVNMSVIGTIINILFNIVLVHKFMHMGLALATSLSMFAAFVGVYYKLSKRYRLEHKRLLKLIIQVLISCIIMVLMLQIDLWSTIDNKYLQLLVRVVCASCVYLISMILMRCQDVKGLISVFTMKLYRK